METREQRRWNRYDITLQVDVIAMIGGEQVVLKGRASDMSKGGMRLFVSRAIEPGISLSMTFHLPYQTKELAIRGIVRNRERFTHGVEFIRPTPQQQHVIERTCSVFALLQR